MDPRFDQMFDRDPSNSVFKVVFYPDRVYHAAYFNATRSSRYRYNVLEVRNAFDITVLKAEVYMDGVFLGNVLRVEYRASRLTEVARERNRFLRSRVIMQIRLLTSDPIAPPAGPSATLSLHYDKWINSYQTEIWETVTLPPRKHHDVRCSIRSAVRGRSRASPISRTCSTISKVFVGLSCHSARTTSICRSGIQ